MPPSQPSPPLPPKTEGPAKQFGAATSVPWALQLWGLHVRPTQSLGHGHRGPVSRGRAPGKRVAGAALPIGPAFAGKPTLRLGGWRPPEASRDSRALCVKGPRGAQVHVRRRARARPRPTGSSFAGDWDPTSVTGADAGRARDAHPGPGRALTTAGGRTQSLWSTDPGAPRRQGPEEPHEAGPELPAHRASQQGLASPRVSDRQGLGSHS